MTLKPMHIANSLNISASMQNKHLLLLYRLLVVSLVPLFFFKLNSVEGCGGCGPCK